MNNSPDKFFFGESMAGSWSNFRDSYGLANDNFTEDAIEAMIESAELFEERGWKEPATGAWAEVDAMKWTFRHFRKKQFKIVNGG